MSHFEQDPFLSSEDSDNATPERTPVETPRERAAREAARLAVDKAEYSCVLYTELFNGVATATGEAIGFNVITPTTIPWKDRFSFGLATWAQMHSRCYLQEYAPEFAQHSGSIAWSSIFARAARNSGAAVLVLQVPLRRYHSSRLINVEIPVTIHIMKVRTGIVQATDDSLHNLLHANTLEAKDVKTRMFQANPRGKVLLYTPQLGGAVVYSRYTEGSVSVGRFRHANRSSI